MKEIVKLIDTILGTEIANLQLERAKLSGSRSKSASAEALDAVIAAKKATRENLPSSK